MNFIEILFIGIGLAMDAVAVAVCKGMVLKKLTIKKVIIIALYFGTFQALMPIIGFSLGITFSKLVSKIDHWIAFFLLISIGINMIIEAFSKDTESANDKLDCKTMLILAIATSIDALTIGITFAFFNTNIVEASIIIGIITFILSALGVKIGHKFGNKLKEKTEFIGGIILILIGVRILIEHMG